MASNYPDEISISGLKVSCVIGIYPEERQKKQDVIVDMKLSLSTSDAAAQSRIDSTIDYSVVAQEARAILQESQFGLIETAAETVANYLLWVGRSKGCQQVTVKIEKTHALRGVAIPALQITRTAACQPMSPAKEDLEDLSLIYQSNDSGLYQIKLPQHGRYSHRCLLGKRWVLLTRENGIFVNSQRVEPWRRTVLKPNQLNEITSLSAPNSHLLLISRQLTLPFPLQNPASGAVVNDLH